MTETETELAPPAAPAAGWRLDPTDGVVREDGYRGRAGLLLHWVGPAGAALPERVGRFRGDLQATVRERVAWLDSVRLRVRLHRQILEIKNVLEEATSQIEALEIQRRGALLAGAEAADVEQRLAAVRARQTASAERLSELERLSATEGRQVIQDLTQAVHQAAREREAALEECRLAVLSQLEATAAPLLAELSEVLSEQAGLAHACRHALGSLEAARPGLDDADALLATLQLL